MARTSRLVIIAVGCSLILPGLSRAQDVAPALTDRQVLVGFSSGAKTSDIDALKARFGVTKSAPLPGQQAEIWTLPRVDSALMQALNAGRLFAGADYLGGGARTPLVPVAETWLTPDAAKALAAFRAAPTIGATSVARVRPGNLTFNVLKSLYSARDPSLVEPKQSDVILELPGGETIQAQRSSFTRHGDETVWTGETFTSEAPDAPAGDMALTVTKRGASGFLTVGVQSYAIRALGDGASAIARIDRGALPPDHVSGSQIVAANPLDMALAVPAVGVTVIRVGVAVTPLAAARIDGVWGVDLASYVDSIFVLAQAGLDRSNVRIKLELADVLRLSSNETGAWGQDVANLSKTGDGIWDEVDAWRGRTRADLVVGLVGSDDACGESAAIHADKAQAFAIVSYLCAQPSYSFIHEIGHLLGARHDQFADVKSAPYAYGHGFVFANEWRTIMAYKSDAGPCKSCGRVNIWASPDVVFRGVRTGNATLNNDVRVLNENAARVAAFEP
jgi:hypothetical protein